MPDVYAGATLEVGGTITPEQYERIKALIFGCGVPDDGEVSEARIRIYKADEAWGRFTALEDYLRREKIPYDAHSEGKYDVDACVWRYRPELRDEPFEFLADQQGSIVVLASVLRSAMQESRTLEELRSRIAQLIGDDLPPLPPLQVIR